MDEKKQNHSSRGQGIQVFSGAQLKYIAFASMLIDHVNKALIYPYLNGGVLLLVSDIFDVLGRIAFPLFAFLLVEGYFQTRSKGQYLRQLLTFGVIAEIPYDLFSTGTWFSPHGNNVLFTLALMLVMIWLIDALRVRMRHLGRGVWFTAAVVIVAVMCLISMLLGVDYEYHAMLIGFFFYLFHGKTLLAIPFGYLAMYKEVWSLLGFGLTLTYNGQRGTQNKWFNYCFYPVHLLILGLLRLWLDI